MKKVLFISIFLPLMGMAQFGVKDSSLKKLINKIDSFNNGRYTDSFPLGRFRQSDFQHSYSFRKSLENDMKAMNKMALDTNDLISLSLLEFENKNQLAHYEFKQYLNPLLSDYGFHIAFVGEASAAFNNSKEVEQYLKKLQVFPVYVDDHLALIRDGLKQGICQPPVVIEGLRSTYESHIIDSVEKSMFYRPFVKRPLLVSEQDWVKYQQRGRQIIRSIIVPQYVRLKKFFEQDYLPNTRKTLGATDMPGGQNLYQQRVDYFTTMSMPFEEVYQIGLREVARIESDMQQVMREVKFAGDLKAFIVMLRTDPRFYVTSPEALLKEASFIAKRVDWVLPKYFGKLPRQPYGVQPVPAFLAPGYTAGRYSGAPVNSMKAGEYWVNTTNLSSRPLYALESLTLHEAVPGHHLQTALTQELQHVPVFRRNYYLSAFGEGWALYSEYLGTEMGFFQDPYSRFGRLTYDMWRACRLVIDVGIHAKGWTREQAVGYLADHTALSMHEVNTEIIRYIAWPGQAVSYKIGELKIRELRKKAEGALGSKFDIRAFHDMVLSQGTVTLGILEQMTDAFIAANK
jgi:uncharacterized protein (DUF885 family)